MYGEKQKELVDKIVRCVITQLENCKESGYEITVNISARHVHLSKEHVEILFGKNHTITPIRELMQPGEFAAKETVMVIGPKGVIQNVRVLGPLRDKTQVEISKTDGYTLGIDAPLENREIIRIRLGAYWPSYGGSSIGRWSNMCTQAYTHA